MAQDLKDTLNLPTTDFPMRANLPGREPSRIEHWENVGLYQKVQEKNKGGEPFILHDGPPFTNGDVHIGTALNKVLKDSILRYKSMRGFRTPYIPGWDCHGLPIEHKVAKNLKDEGRSLTPLEIRQSCAEFSKSFIEIQRKQFKRLGILADWEREYRTMNPEYESAILETFSRFVEQGLVYRSKKPVYWSIPCGTALAEAEVEYQDHVSPSIYVHFEIKDASKLNLNGPVSVVIWTTTPWTLPANLAVAVHPRFDYAVIAHEGRNFIVAQDLVDASVSKWGWESYEKVGSVKGEELEGLIAKHPFIDRDSPIVAAEYVTAESGTGCVHTAPGHGLDDYLTGLKYGLEIYCPIDDNGCYVNDGQVPEALVGITVLETKGKCPANKSVLEIIKGNGSLLSVESYRHQYPHCWRSKTPVVFRAMDQWFVSLDQKGHRDAALESISSVKWVPEWGENRIRGSIQNRPDWCISRQRSWGVPIPVFYDEEGNALLDAVVIKGISKKVKSLGTDIWYAQEAQQLLEGIELPAEWQNKTLTKGTDTLDVWIDSGCSHRAVLQKHADMNWPADLYLEGSDQHRGWFQSSLWTAMLADGKPPYKQVVTHGFIVGQDGKKVSKSDGKPQTSDNFVKEYGADVLRLWICSEDYRNDVPLSDEIFKHVSQGYRNIRNTLRFQIANLVDFDVTTNALSASDLSPLDQWVISETDKLVEEVTSCLDQYEFHKAYQLLTRFCGVTLSSLYHDIIKDRMYTLALDNPLRRSSQTAIHHVFNVLVSLFTPILPFTADEAWSYFKENKDFTARPSLLNDWPVKGAIPVSESVCNAVASILAFKSKDVNDKLEDLRKNKEIGQSLEAHITISGDSKNDTMKLLREYEMHLPELMIVSTVSLVESGSAPQVVCQRSEKERCPRCWRRVELVDSSENAVCPRCDEALQALEI
jgi:isoleucyl-tRNA synthetase